MLSEILTVEWLVLTAIADPTLPRMFHYSTISFAPPNTEDAVGPHAAHQIIEIAELRIVNALLLGMRRLLYVVSDGDYRGA
jgi:hypothetical protein